MTNGWSGFSAAQVQALAEAPAFATDPTARICPACGERAIRAYLSAPPGTRRPTLVSYVWCAACRRFVGTRAAHPPGLVFADPLAALDSAERRAVEQSLIGFFAYLDGLWDAGVLPQSFAVAPA